MASFNDNNVKHDLQLRAANSSLHSTGRSSTIFIAAGLRINVLHLKMRSKRPANRLLRNKNEIPWIRVALNGLSVNKQVPFGYLYVNLNSPIDSGKHKRHRNMVRISK